MRCGIFALRSAALWGPGRSVSVHSLCSASSSGMGLCVPKTQQENTAFSPVQTALGRLAFGIAWIGCNTRNTARKHSDRCSIINDYQTPTISLYIQTPEFPSPCRPGMKARWRQAQSGHCLTFQERFCKCNNLILLLHAIRPHPKPTSKSEKNRCVPPPGPCVLTIVCSCVLIKSNFVLGWKTLPSSSAWTSARSP
jgi:hypothetical protein